MDKKVYFITKADINYNKRIIDYLVSIGGDNYYEFTGNACESERLFIRDDDNIISYRTSYDLSDYKLLDIDNLPSQEDNTKDDLKECFNLILRKIHGKDLYQE